VVWGKATTSRNGSTGGSINSVGPSLFVATPPSPAS
jgi:hypothetical protein